MIAAVQAKDHVFTPFSGHAGGREFEYRPDRFTINI